MVDRVLPARALAALRCPHCGQPLAAGSAALGCAGGHRFDLARQGYVALLGSRSRTDTGDDAEMVAARVQFLGAGHYQPIVAALAGALEPAEGVIVDLGAGPGYYLQTLTTAQRPGIAVDASKYAARRAASVPHVLSVLADNWSALPIADAAADAVLSVFAPRNLAQIARILRPGGLLLAVTPEPGHLHGIRNRLGMLTVDPGKAERLAQAAAGLLDPVGRCRVRYEMAVGHGDLAALVRMGPAARHVDVAGLAAAVAALPDPVEVEVEVTVSTLRRR